MLRLPDIRHVLSGVPTEALGDMFESYALAADALDRFRSEKPLQEGLIAEYSELCHEIEQEVILYCSGGLRSQG